MSGSPRPIEVPAEGLSDGRIRLRVLAEADLPAVVAACRDPEIPRWTVVPHNYSDDDAREWLGIAAREQAAGEGLPLLIADAETDELLGSIGVAKIDWDEARGEIGYWLAAAHRGRGVMTAAVRLLAKWAFDELAFARLSICAEPQNTPSCRVAERAGFTYEGLLRSWHLNKGVRRDCAMYSLLRGERQGAAASVSR